MTDILLRMAAFAFGAAIVAGTLISAVRTFVLPRSENTFLTRVVFQAIFRLFQLRLRWARTYAERDRVMAFFSPLALLFLPVVWLTLITVGYTGIFWAVGVTPLYSAFFLSGSSLLTLGFAPVANLAQLVIAYSEATLGLIMVALLISYLPTMYTAFTEREAAVSMLEVRAGDPPSAAEMIIRMHRIKGLQFLTEEWMKWEKWFVDLEQTHTSLIALVFFRSPHVGQSWVVAAGTILDAASLTAATIDKPRDPHAELCIRAGYLALRSIVDFFGLPYNPKPKPTDPISVTRAEFDAVIEQLSVASVPLKPDLEQAWRDFQGWRVNYDRVLLILAGLTMAPTAPWSGDRPILDSKPTLFLHRKS
ncbi:MAG: hypothetical protein FOGNACKC_01928 [Anaerolineae bacterium]|nr:hypothetical protein [Anaerolineae bacterium]